MRTELSERERALHRITSPLPGSAPYTLVRPLRVPGRYDRWSLLEFLRDYHPHVPEAEWLEILRTDRMSCEGHSVSCETRVRGGNTLSCVFLEHTEPEVATAIRVIDEDPHLIAVSKPAPLPVHPSGRFNRNTLVSMMALAWPDLSLRVVHRLDADTTGLMLFAKTRAAAQSIGRQFEKAEAEKAYRALVSPEPREDEFEVDQAIARRPSESGSRRIDPAGLPSRTEFRVLARLGDGRAILEARPRTGRTHQVRLHLQAAGTPIIGDRLYGGRQKTEGSGDDPGLCLHAQRLSLVHPGDGRRQTWTTPPAQWDRSAAEN